MQLRNLIQEDRAVSPVIGVILMVAITVILAAVIGTFVLGLGDSLQDTSPQASFGFDYGDSPSNGVTVSHEGGDSIDASEVKIVVDGDTVVASTSDTTAVNNWPGTSDPVQAGSSAVIASDDSGDAHSSNLGDGSDNWDGSTIRVVWTSSDGSSSQTIGTSTAPSN